MLDKTGKELYAERAKRIQDNIELKETNRVPYTFFSHFWSAALAEMTFEEAMYDYDRYNGAMRHAIDILQPDEYALTQIFISLGPTLERMDFQQLQWPGHGTDPNTSYQFLDREYMSADEYDDYLRDPTGFFLQKYMPRVATAFEPLAMLPNFSSLFYTKMIRATTAFANPKMMEGFEKIAEAGREMLKMMVGAIAFNQEMAELGYPQSIGGSGAAPFDHFADYMRGSKGAMLDMFRHPDKLLEAMDRAAYFIAADTIETTKNNPCKQVFIPLHWGLDGFMSLDQFNTFYWPQLRKVILMLIEADLTPCVLWEGDCQSRLEFIGDIPPKKAIYWFEKTDLKKAKDVLGDIVCLRGNVPSSMLTTGTADDVDEYCCDLIKSVGKGGGFILDGAIGVPDEAKTENVIAMAQSVHKYAN